MVREFTSPVGDLLTKLGIDWRLLIAQLVNFLILFFVLRKFLFRPVLTALEQRRATIAKGLEDAKRAEVARQDMTMERRQLHATAEAERAAMLSRAAEEAEALRAQRVAAAEGEALAIIARGERDAAQAKQAAFADVRREAASVLLIVAEKVTGGALTDAEHRKIADRAMEELQTTP